MKFLYILPIFFICSCTNNRLIKDMRSLMGQQITVSVDWNTVLKGKDTVLSDFTKVPIKLIVWVDSLGCTSCEANSMYMWKDIANYADSLSQWFNIIFLFTPKKKDLPALSTVLTRELLDYPIFIDLNGRFVRQNPNLPKNRQLHTFLLDKNNKVVMVGSPLYNPTLWKLYKRTIQTMINNDGVLPTQLHP